MEARLEDSFTKKDYPVKNDCVHCVLRKQAAVVTFYQSGWRRPCLWGGHSCRAADSWGQATARGFTVTWGQTGAGPFWTHQVRNQGPEPDAVDISRVLKERFETWNLGSTDMFFPGQHRGDRYWNWYIFEVKIQNAVTKFRLNQWWNVTSKNLLRYSAEVQFWSTVFQFSATTFWRKIFNFNYFTSTKHNLSLSYQQSDKNPTDNQKNVEYQNW